MYVPSPICPVLLYPQQYDLPFETTAQPRLAPADMSMTVSPLGMPLGPTTTGRGVFDLLTLGEVPTPNCPTWLYPQQYTFLLLVSMQE